MNNELSHKIWPLPAEVRVVVQWFQVCDGVLYLRPDGLEGGDVLSKAVLVRLGEVRGVVVRRVLVGGGGACGAEKRPEIN